MKRTRLNRIGKVGRANLESTQILKSILGHTNQCEMRLEGCTVSWPLQFAHRHKRSWYKGDVAKLSDIKQVVVACQNCHEKTEFNRELNDEVFQELRGDE
jgi:hypothetical protein